MIAAAFTVALVVVAITWPTKRTGYRATWRQRRAWRRERADVTPALRGRS